MKKTLLFMLSLLLIVSIPGIATAKGTGQGKGQGKGKATGNTKQVAGEVIAVDAKVKSLTLKGKEVVTFDAAAMTLTVKGNDAKYTIATDENTRVKIGKDAKSFTDVKKDDKVMIKYYETGGQTIAKNIKIVPANIQNSIRILQQ